MKCAVLHYVTVCVILSEIAILTLPDYKPLLLYEHSNVSRLYTILYDCREP
jgi:hypothetical protein